MTEQMLERLVDMLSSGLGQVLQVAGISHLFALREGNADSGGIWKQQSL
ncbi:MAG: hypothetical protein AAGA75_11945 [Cyanobacteria bacterium P01_E01_bin.6]